MLDANDTQSIKSSSSETDTVELFNPFRADYLTNPYPFYDYYRKVEPVHWGAPVSPVAQMNDPGCWFIFTYNDCTAMLKEARLGRNPRNIMSPEKLPRTPVQFKPFVDMLNDWILVQDPPVHTRLRSLLNRAFTSQAVEVVRPRIEEVCNFLIDRVQTDGGMDLIKDFALPLPAIVIAEMLGLPSGSEDRELLAQWSLAFMSGLSLKPGKTALVQASKAAQNFYDYVREIIAQRRVKPKDDIISSLVAAEKQGQLTEAELLAMCGQLIQAGLETTINLIGNGTLALLQNPDQFELLKKNLSPELVENAVEELLRYDSPTQMALRMAFEDFEFAGKQIRKGQELIMMLGSANHDPQQYENPEKLDITHKVGKHQSFGLGIHFCAGAPLARAEAQIAFTTLATRLPNLRLAISEHELNWQEKVGFRGLKALPVVFESK